MPTALQQVEVGANLGFFNLKGRWAVSEVEAQAAWSLYVELATRISTVPLDRDHGLLREALSSLYSIFETIRTLLKAGGPALARSKKGSLSFAILAVVVMNQGLRPFMSRWHPLLEDHEAQRDPKVSRLAHERAWEHEASMRAELEALRQKLTIYAELLELAAGLTPEQSLLDTHAPDAEQRD